MTRVCIRKTNAYTAGHLLTYYGPTGLLIYIIYVPSGVWGGESVCAVCGPREVFSTCVDEWIGSRRGGCILENAFSLLEPRVGDGGGGSHPRTTVGFARAGKSIAGGDNVGRRRRRRRTRMLRLFRHRRSGRRVGPSARGTVTAAEYCVKQYRIYKKVTLCAPVLARIPVVAVQVSRSIIVGARVQIASSSSYTYTGGGRGAILSP